MTFTFTFNKTVKYDERNNKVSDTNATFNMDVSDEAVIASIESTNKALVAIAKPIKEIITNPAVLDAIIQTEKIEAEKTPRHIIREQVDEYLEDVRHNDHRQEAVNMNDVFAAEAALSNGINQ